MERDGRGGDLCNSVDGPFYPVRQKWNWGAHLPVHGDLRRIMCFPGTRKRETCRRPFNGLAEQLADLSFGCLAFAFAA